MRCRISGVDHSIESQELSRAVAAAARRDREPLSNNESLNSLGLLAPPISQDGSNGSGAALSDDPNQLLVRIVPNLVLRPGRDECKVSRLKLVMSQFALETLLDDERAGTGHCVDDGVLTALSETEANQPTGPFLGKMEGTPEAGGGGNLPCSLLWWIGELELGGMRRTVCKRERKRKRVTTQFLARFVQRGQGKDSPEAHILSHLPTTAASRMERPSLSRMGVSWSARVTSVVDGRIMGRISVMMGSSDDMAQDIQRQDVGLRSLLAAETNQQAVSMRVNCQFPSVAVVPADSLSLSRCSVCRVPAALVRLGWGCRGCNEDTQGGKTRPN